jgi:hypothetical protein
VLWSLLAVKVGTLNTHGVCTISLQAAVHPLTGSHTNKQTNKYIQNIQYYTVTGIIIIIIVVFAINLREERRLRVFENRVFWRIFGPKRDEVRGVWRKLHNEELNDLYSSPAIVRVIKSRRMR